VGRFLDIRDIGYSGRLDAPVQVVSGACLTEGRVTAYSFCMTLAPTLRTEQLSTFGAAEHVELVTVWRNLVSVDVLRDGLALGISATVESIMGRVLVPVLKVFVAYMTVIVFLAMLLVLLH
jgi:hypothetical protein